MNTIFLLLWLIANVVMIVFIVKAIREKDVDAKKQKRKIWLICFAVAMVAFFAFGSTTEPTDNEGELKTQTSVNDDSNTNVVSDVEATSEEPNSNAIELVAGEKGDYGKEVVMSEGTDLEEHLIVYYLPAGTYTVKNLGDYRTQISVYEGFSKNVETGYDEYTQTGDIVLLNKNESGDIEIPDGWFIEIQEPTHISLTAK